MLDTTIFQQDWNFWSQNGMALALNNAVLFKTVVENNMKYECNLNSFR
jgi:hypothetical protein